MIFGLPWWLALVLVLAGIAIGYWVVPHVDDRPHIVTAEPRPTLSA